MTIECYYDACPHHGTHSGDEGPFCFEADCKATDQEIKWFGQIRTLQLQVWELESSATEAWAKTMRQRVKDLEYEAGYKQPIDPGDESYPNPIDVAACLRNCSEDLHTEARYVLWQGRQIAELRDVHDDPVGFVRMETQGKPILELITFAGQSRLKDGDLLYAASGVPEGWQLVPVKHTEEMFRAMTDAFISINGDARQYFECGYQAMLAASPKHGDNNA